MQSRDLRFWLQNQGQLPTPLEPELGLRWPGGPQSQGPQSQGLPSLDGIRGRGAAGALRDPQRRPVLFSGS